MTPTTWPTIFGNVSKIKRDWAMLVQNAISALQLWAVGLQPQTPGTAQEGHTNITGTSKAAHFVGDGSGLTGVHADSADSIDGGTY